MKFNPNNFKVIAKTLFGIEELLAQEIKQLGGKDIEILKRAVSFYSDYRLLYKSNLWLRTALKLIVPIHMFRAKNEKDLYLRTKEFKWFELITPENTFAVESTVNSKNFNHSKYVALKTKDAIVDRIRNKFNKRPNIDTANPDYLINIHIYNEDVTISLDSSGDSLHKRGYRISQVDAPLNEVLAAGMILFSGWNQSDDFIDPMCGSGTLLMEATTMMLNIPPGFKRNFGFMKWNDFNQDIWIEILNEAKNIKHNSNQKIFGYDNSPKAIAVSKKNLQNFGYFDSIKLKQQNFFNIKPKNNKGVLIFNPPYDERMKDENINEFYKKIGDKLKNDFKGYSAWIISSNIEAMKKIGLKPSRKIQLFNGKLETRYIKYEMY